MATTEVSVSTVGEEMVLANFEAEIRCYIRDPDGYVIEVGQTTLPRGWRPPS
jgi:hypothetical protein